MSILLSERREWAARRAVHAQVEKNEKLGVRLMPYFSRFELLAPANAFDHSMIHKRRAPPPERQDLVDGA